MSGFLQVAAGVSLTVVAVSMGLVALRVIRGRTVPDRVISLDLAGVLVVATIGIAAVAYDSDSLIDVAIVTAIVSFLGTVAFARYLERRVKRG